MMKGTRTKTERQEKEDKGPGSAEHIRKHIQRIGTRAEPKARKDRTTMVQERGGGSWGTHVVDENANNLCWLRVVSRGRRRVKHHMESNNESERK